MVRPRLSQCKLIVFDYDGVIADSLTSALAAAASAGRSLGLRKTELSAEDLAHLDTITFESIGLLMGCGSGEVERFRDLIFAKMRQESATVQLFPGITDVLRQLAQQRIVCVVSANAADVVHRVLEREGIVDHISAIVGGDRPGDKAVKIAGLVDRFACQPSSAVMVGDALSDLHSAERAGVGSIAVAWGWQPLTALCAAGPDAVAHRPSQLLSLLLEPETPLATGG